MPSWYSLASKRAWFLNKTSLRSNFKWFGFCTRWEFVQYLLGTLPSSYDEHWIPVRFLLFVVVVCWCCCWCCCLLSTLPSSYDEHWIPVRSLLFIVVVCWCCCWCCCLLSTLHSSYDEHWISVRFLLFTVVVFLLLFLVFVVCCCMSRTACVTATVFVTRCQNIALPVHFTTHGYYILRLFRYHKKPRMMALMLMVRRRSRSLPSSLGPLVWSNQGARTTTLADDITWWLCSFSWRCCDHDFDGCGESL